MANSNLEVAVAPDRSAVLPTLADGREAFATRLEAPELDEGARITNSIADPNYLVGTNSRKGQTLLAFHPGFRWPGFGWPGFGWPGFGWPGFGWIGFRLRRPVVEAMVRKLGQWLEGRPR
jgi:hypothetical protein